MCRNRNRGILRNIAGYLRGALLDDEAAEAAFSAPVLLAISFTISAFVIVVKN